MAIMFFWNDSSVRPDRFFATKLWRSLVFILQGCSLYARFCIVVELQPRSLDPIMRGASFATCFSAVLSNVKPCEWWSHALLKFCVCRATAQNRRTVAFG